MYRAKLSVRNLVEFILREGDIDAGSGRGGDPDAMQEGARIHRKIQNSQPVYYKAEVPVSGTFKSFVPAQKLGIKDSNLAFETEIEVEGRMDGLCINDGKILIDEIKSMYVNLERVKEPVKVHLAQAKSYAYMYLLKVNSGQEDLPATDRAYIRMTYVNIETEEIKYFDSEWSFNELEDWFIGIIDEYAKWVAFEGLHRDERNACLKMLDFPFPYRVGQNDLVKGVYRTIMRKKKIFIEAPTGVGKTVSTLYPAVRAMGEGLSGKIFYLTAKTIARTVAEQTCSIFKEKNARLISTTITAKDKICIFDRAECNPAACERAKGHFDRINEAVFDILLNEECITRPVIAKYAEKHNVCPFEMSLDISLWSDIVICDYNYAFDPEAHLKRFFDGVGDDYIFLIDEAHNLPARAREMYSAVLVKEDFLEVRRLINKKEFGYEGKRLAARLEAVNKELLELKRETEGMLILPDAEELNKKLMSLTSAFDDLLDEYKNFEGRDLALDLYFNVYHFINMYELLSDKYMIYADFRDNGDFVFHLACMDPSDNLKRYLDKGRSAVFFSATLLPVNYYKEQLGGSADDYAVYAPSPFDPAKRLVLVGLDVTTKYTRRSLSEYEKIAAYINEVAAAKKGNYMVFFPSYKFMTDVQEAITKVLPEDVTLKVQGSGMDEEEREEFLSAFAEGGEKTVIGFCVMGGIFAEGIDLTGERLIGAVVVGTGLPQVCREQELYKDYFDEKNGRGFDYAYLYNGMNKVLQSAGRVIRTTEDTGVIVLLDERFEKDEYKNLFPREWFPYEKVTKATIGKRLDEFWKKF